MSLIQTKGGIRNFAHERIHLEGSRLIIRTLTSEDATEKYANWLNDPDINRFLATKSATIGSVREYINARNEQSNCLFFGIFLHGDHIGTIKLEPIDLKKKTATIAIMLGDKRLWGHGYGPEALRILIRYGFDVLELHDINLGVISDNHGAIRSYEKVGFRERHRTIKSIRYGDNVYDHVTMEVTPSSFI